MSEYFKTLFWGRAFERAVKTAAQTAVLLLGADGVDVLSVDYKDTAVLVATSAALSILTSIASARIGDSDDPSMI